MKAISFTHGSRTYDITDSYPLSIPLDFDGAQPNAYGVPPATSVPFSGEGFILDTRQGGSCNCNTITFTPHCHGTHTECIGHITKLRCSVDLLDPFLAATLITVTPVGREITADAIEIVKYDAKFLEALIVRTLPNDDSKKKRRWENDTTPYFTPDAMKAIRNLGVEHLLVDLPSIDPIDDGGKLAAHRIFWDLPKNAPEVREQLSLNTITEMIYVNDDLEDGRYFLTIEMPSLGTDAVPSRPILHRFREES